jgi:excisionase family DNA binding protein
MTDNTDQNRSAILTVDQAAELLGVRPKTVRALAAGGIIPGVKVGKPWRFDETLLREWLVTRSRENVRHSLAIDAQPARPGIALKGITAKPAAASLSARLDELLASQVAPTSQPQRPRGVRSKPVPKR